MTEQELISVAEFCGLDLCEISYTRVINAAYQLMDEDIGATLIWLTTAVSLFNEATPALHAKTKAGVDDVLTLIGRIEHGIFS
ncbi:antitoxin Xre/MbcA/ParS toxin-binding domain-containing protein [Zhongshania guokunii]|uniref:Antitoxin Xre/MbcA/ParS toxin-binding domain-containing protein n=1 Tax=Zhongshania guokunii TaxID=641783 RepID=A0ABV3U9M5_9GAMM